MNMGINFPSQADVIREEVARFRSLSPRDQVLALGEMFRLYHFLASASGRAEELGRLAEEDEARQRKAIEEFVARHA